jgi:hypothetical protein
MSTINDEEDIWAFDDQGWKWADIGALKDDKVADGAEEEEEEEEEAEEEAEEEEA